MDKATQGFNIVKNLYRTTKHIPLHGKLLLKNVNDLIDLKGVRGPLAENVKKVKIGRIKLHTQQIGKGLILPTAGTAVIGGGVKMINDNEKVAFLGFKSHKERAKELQTQFDDFTNYLYTNVKHKRMSKPEARDTIVAMQTLFEHGHIMDIPQSKIGIEQVLFDEHGTPYPGNDFDISEAYRKNKIKGYNEKKAEYIFEKLAFEGFLNPLKESKGLMGGIKRYLGGTAKYELRESAAKQGLDADAIFKKRDTIEKATKIDPTNPSAVLSSAEKEFLSAHNRAATKTLRTRVGVGSVAGVAALTTKRQMNRKQFKDMEIPQQDINQIQ